jgi:glucose-6-phosphate 1-dehydrogenase
MLRREMVRASEIKDIISDIEKAIFYISGPPQKVREITTILRDAGVKPSRERIKVESFTGY